MNTRVHFNESTAPLNVYHGRLFRFENGYGASVIPFNSPPTMELVVLQFDLTNPNDPGHIVYDTPITSDVLLHIHGETQLQEVLARIAAL